MEPQKVLDPQQLTALSGLFLEYGPYFLGLVLLLGITLLWSGRDRLDVRIVGAVTLGLSAAVFVFALRDWSETRVLARAEIERARTAGHKLAEDEIAEERRRLAAEREALQRRQADLDRLQEALREQAPFQELEFHLAGDLPQITEIELPQELARHNFRVVHQLDAATGRFVVVIYGPRALSRDQVSMILLRFAHPPRLELLCLYRLSEALAIEIIGEPESTPGGTIKLVPVAYGIRRDGVRFRLPCED